MDAVSAPHPTDQTLSSYSLGKLDDRMAEAVNMHLEECQDCRKRVAGMSADSFLERVRDAQKPSGKSRFGGSEHAGTRSDKVLSAPPPAQTLPAGLADHPDYEIKRELGRGGMGVVYLAHNKLMGRDEVLKVIGRQIMERPGALERFLREIRAVAKLRHPNIVAAYSAVRLGESIVFAMEYVEGLDLSRMVKAKGPLPVAHACSFVHQAALGLQHAHEEGLVHRDIKPGNLMLSRKADKAVVKVLDFGLAKVTREEKVDGGLTSQGQALGTPDFIAPEQILDAQSADVRADIYSLGATLYYLLTGHPPFQANSLYDMYQAHISRDADPLNLVRPEVPAELAAVVAKLMAKDPARRFQTPGEVAAALTPFFKKGNLAFKSPRIEASQAGETSTGRPVAGTASAPPQPVTDPGGPVFRTQKAAEDTVLESHWENLTGSGETHRSVDPAPAVEPVRRPPPAYWLKLIAASLFGLIVLGVIIITIKNRNGNITKITVGDHESATIEVNPPKSTEGGGGINSSMSGISGGISGMGGGMSSTSGGMSGMAGMMGGMAMMDDDPSPKTRTIWAKLNKPIAIKFPEETAFEVVLAFIRKATKGPKDSGVPIYLDPDGLGEVQKTVASTVIIDEENVTVKDSLERVLQQLGLTYCVRNGILFISTSGNVTSEKSQPLLAPTDDLPQSRAIGAKFDETIAMRFPQDTPLKEILKYLKVALKGPKDAGVQIYVDPKGLAKAEKTLTSPVKMDLEGVPLRTSLRLLLKQIGLHFSLKKGLLYITAESQGGMMGSMMGSMMRGSMAGKAEGGMMSGYGDMMGRNGLVNDDSSPRTKAVRPKLDLPIPIKFPDPTPLEDVLKSIKQLTKGPNDTGIPIYVEPNGLQEAEKSLSSLVTIDLENIPLKDSMELILEQLGLDYCIRDGLMFISTSSSVANEKSQPLPATTDASAESRGITAKLDEPIAMKIPNPTPLKDVLKYLTNVLRGQNDAAFKIVADTRELQKEGKSITSTVTMDVQGVPLRTTLRLLLKQIGLAFSLDKGAVHITAENQMGAMGSMMGSMMRGMGSKESKDPSTGGMMSGMGAAFGKQPDMEGSNTGSAKRKRTTPKGTKPGPSGKD